MLAGLQCSHMKFHMPAGLQCRQIIMHMMEGYRQCSLIILHLLTFTPAVAALVYVKIRHKPGLSRKLFITFLMRFFYIRHYKYIFFLLD